MDRWESNLAEAAVGNLGVQWKHPSKIGTRLQSMSSQPGSLIFTNLSHEQLYRPKVKFVVRRLTTSLQ